MAAAGPRVLPLTRAPPRIALAGSLAWHGPPSHSHFPEMPEATPLESGPLARSPSCCLASRELSAGPQ